MRLVPCLVFALSVFALHSLSAAANCATQRVFPEGFASPVVCDGDAGGSQIRVFGTSIIYEVKGGQLENVEGFPSVTLPEKLILKVARFPNGRIRPNKSFIQIENKKWFFGAGQLATKNFRLYFNVLQVLVKQFETGNCPIDGGLAVPELASVRGGLLALASVFNVKDCSGGIV